MLEGPKLDLNLKGHFCHWLYFQVLKCDIVITNLMSMVKISHVYSQGSFFLLDAGDIEKSKLTTDGWLNTIPAEWTLWTGAIQAGLFRWPTR